MFCGWLLRINLLPLKVCIKNNVNVNVELKLDVNVELKLDVNIISCKMSLNMYINRIKEIFHDP